MGKASKVNANDISILNERVSDPSPPAARRTLTEAEIYAVDGTNWSWPPNFKSTRNGQTITSSILTASKTERYAVILDYPCRAECFDKCLFNGIKHCVY